MRYYALAERPWIEEEDGAGYWGLPDGAIGSVDLAPLGSQSFVFVTSDQPISGEAVFGDGTRLHQHSLTPAERTAWTGLTGVVLPSDVTLLDALWHTLTAAADPDGAERAKPIMPTHRGRLELHLGGHSLVRAEQMPADPTQHPAWPRIQAVLQADYREIHEGAEVKGRAFAQRVGGNPTQARKYLGAMADKYRLPPEDASRLLIPHGMAREAPLRPTTTVSDDFNRPDGPVGAPWAGSEVDEWLVEGGALRGSQRSSIYFNSPLSSDDMYSECDVLDMSAVNYVAGPSCRHIGDSTYYVAWLRWGSGTNLLDRVVNGSRSSLGSVSNANPGSQRVRVTADGSTISFWVGGGEILTRTDTAITGAPYGGITDHPAKQGAGAVYDTWSAADLLAPPVEIDLDADPVSTAPPTIGSISVRQRQQLNAEAAAATAPVIGEAHIRQAQTVIANPASAVPPAIGATEIRQAQAMQAVDAAASPPDAAPAEVSQHQRLHADGVAAAHPIIGHALVAGDGAIVRADGITAAPSAIGEARVAQEQSLAADRVATGAPAIGAVSITQEQPLALAGAISGGPDIGSVSISQHQALGALSIAALPPIIGHAAITVDGVLPDVQVTVPGVWQRRTAQGFWRRVS